MVGETTNIVKYVNTTFLLFKFNLLVGIINSLVLIFETQMISFVSFLFRVSAQITIVFEYRCLFLNVVVIVNHREIDSKFKIFFFVRGFYFFQFRIDKISNVTLSINDITRCFCVKN